MMPMAINIQTCALTFQGNASNKRQQDAFFFLDDWYQTELGITEILENNNEFCVAVSYGVASSNYSQHCAKAVVKAISKLWSTDKFINRTAIHNLINHSKQAQKHYGAAATLALVIGKPTSASTYSLTITHVGDSRVYLLAAASGQWQCLTRDHNLLNELIDDKAREKGFDVNPEDYNAEGMAGSLYSLTECFIFADDEDNDAPNSGVQTLTVGAGDSMVVCSDGIHDLVPCAQWHTVNHKTDLQEWLTALKRQVYASEGNAYDNGTAILIRFSD
jgi:serine/threonine protein phosphatase PrpC